jgi:hypothetical protein
MIEYSEEQLSRLCEEWFDLGVRTEVKRIIELLTELDVIRRDALGYLVAMDTYGQNCIYLTGLEPSKRRKQMNNQEAKERTSEARLLQLPKKQVPIA